MPSPSGHTPRSVTLTIDDGQHVAGLWLCPDDAMACYVFAHGAGAGMNHRFMVDVAERLAAHGIATLRYQFPYMERGSKRVDAPATAHGAVRAAVAAAAELGRGLPMFAGGKSFGARMTSQAQAIAPLAGVLGLAFFGFPLHPSGKPSIARAEHLAGVDVPMLFLQGTRDTLADMSLVEQVAAGLGKATTLHVLDHADHSFHVLVRSGRTDPEVMDEAIAAMVAWCGALARRGNAS